MNDRKGVNRISYSNSVATLAVSDAHLQKGALFSLNLNLRCDMLEAASNSAARVCSCSPQISSGERVGDGWKEAWFF